MSDKQHLPPSRAALYAAIYPVMVKVAKRHGYCLGLHGSMIRDMDVVAVPWIEDASEPLVLFKALRDELGGCFHHFEHDHHWDDAALLKESACKPHGRMALPIHLTNDGCHGPYVDLSILPKAAFQ